MEFWKHCRDISLPANHGFWIGFQAVVGRSRVLAPLVKLPCTFLHVSGGCIIQLTIFSRAEIERLAFLLCNSFPLFQSIIRTPNYPPTRFTYYLLLQIRCWYIYIYWASSPFSSVPIKLLSENYFWERRKKFESLLKLTSNV